MLSQTTQKHQKPAPYLQLWGSPYLLSFSLIFLVWGSTILNTEAH